MNPVPLGARNIPGFDAFLAEIYNGLDYNGVTGIEAAVFAGVADPYDYVDTLNEKAVSTMTSTWRPSTRLTVTKA